MGKFYEFLTGPVLWAVFSIFIVGLVVRVTYFYALSRKADCHKKIDLKSAIRRIFHWSAPLGNDSALQSGPFFKTISFVFHVCLLGVPLFLLAHNTLWEDAFGYGLPSLPDFLSDTLTMIFLVSALLLAGQIINAGAGTLSKIRDYSVLFLCCAPFVTGFLAYRQIGPYEMTLTLHVLFAELLLLVIPFSVGRSVLFSRGR